MQTKETIKKIFCLILTLVMIANVNVPGVGTEVKAASGYDIILTSVGMYQENGTTKAYADYCNVGDASVDTNFKMNFYVDKGGKTTTTAESSGLKPGEMRRVSVALSKNYSGKHSITAVADIKDADTSNNNRTSYRGVSSAEPDTTKAPEVTTKTPETTTKTPETTTKTPETTTKAPETTTIGVKLSIADVSWTPQNPTEGESVTFTVQVKNDGDTAANNVPVELSVNGKTFSGSVNVGANATANVVLNEKWTSVKGTYDVNAKATYSGTSVTSKKSITVSEKTPDAVTGIVSPEVGTNSIKLTWNASANAEYYIIKRNGVQIATNVVNAEYTDNNLSANTEYTYEIIAVNGSKQSTASSFKVTTQNTQTENPNGKPDLVITDISWTPAEPKSGDRVVFSATIKNQGDKSTPSGTKHGVHFAVDTHDYNTALAYTWSDEFNGPLKPGESKTVTANGGKGDIAYWTAVKGTYTVYAEVDDNGGIIEESDESNNISTKTIKVDVVDVTIPDGEVGSGTVKAYPVPSGRTQSDGIALSANNQSVGVFKTRVNENRQWYGNTYEGNLYTDVAMFDFKGETVVRVRSTRSDINSVNIRPYSKGVNAAISHEGGGTTISFKLDDSTQGQYVLEFNGSYRAADTLMLFANPIEEVPTGNVRTIRSGERYDGEISLSDGQTLYIEGGGIVYGRVHMGNNSSIKGSGVVCGSNYAAWGGVNRNFPININRKSHVNIEGISILDSPCWNCEVFTSSDVHFKSVEIVSARPNGDGISIQSSSNVTIDNCFLRTWDDGVVLKNYSDQNTHDVTVTNTRFWTDFAQTMEIGFETNAGYEGQPANPQIYNVEFRDIDVIHAFHKAVMSIHNADRCEVHHVKWTNINVEHRVCEGDGWPYMIDITCMKAGFPGTDASWSNNWADSASIHDVTFTNINKYGNTMGNRCDGVNISNINGM